MFSGVIEERMRDRQVFVVDTTPPEQEEGERQKSLILEHVKSSLAPQHEATAEVEQPEALDPNRTFGGLGNADQLRRHVRELLENHEWTAGPDAGHIPILVGDVVISPPYAGDWHVGSGFSFGATADGSVSTIGISGYSAAGINVSMSSNAAKPVSAAITPVGTYNYSWAAFEDLPSLQTRGGLSVAVHLDDQLVMSRDALLWTQSGATVFAGQSGEGHIADAASPAFGLGPVPIGPVLIDMAPGRQYLLTVWCWQVAEFPENASFLGLLGMKMPAVRLSVGPPRLIG